jgi:hypothetical protein
MTIHADSIIAVEQALNKYLLHQADTLDPLDEEVRNLIESIAFYILKKENLPRCAAPIAPPGYYTPKDFASKHKWISRTTIWYLPKIYPEGDFYYRNKNRFFYHPKKTFDVYKSYSPQVRKRLEKLEKNGSVKFDCGNNI